MTDAQRKAMEEMATRMGHRRQDPQTCSDDDPAGGRLLGAVPASWKTNPNKHENQFMMDLMLLRNAILLRAEKVKDRLGMVNPHAWRDLRLLFSLVDRIQKELISTMPDSRIEYYDALARHGRYHLDVEGPIRKGRAVVITDMKLAALCEAVMESECVMCLKDGKDIETCPIREALLEVAPPSETQVDGSVYRCEYAGAAGQLIEGHEVTI